MIFDLISASHDRESKIATNGRSVIPQIEEMYAQMTFAKISDILTSYSCNKKILFITIVQTDV